MIESTINKFFNLLRVIRDTLIPMRLLETQKDFIQENKKFWASLPQTGPSDEYVLVENRKHPVIYLSNAAFSTIVSRAGNLKILFLTTTSMQTDQKQILRSYPNAEFVNINGPRYFFARIRAWFQAKKALRDIHTPEQLLHWQIDGLPFGSTVYDTVLSFGYATIDSIDENVFIAMYNFMKMRLIIKDILKRYNIKLAVASQLMGYQGGTLAKYLLKNNIVIFNRAGSHQIVIKKYRSVDEIGVDIRAPLPEIFNHFVETDDGTIEQLAEDYIQKRFGGSLKRIDAVAAFGKHKKTYTTREEFGKDFDLDPSKPNVFIMLHAFNDCPHWNYPRKMLYVDYYHWFMETIKIAQKAKQVNWIFKEHPTQRYYPTKDLDINEVMRSVENDHIRFLDANAPFNTQSLRFIAHALVTGTGTAGLEFATCGVPCILVGEGSYSGFEFTNEPQTIEEYEELMLTIDQLSKLTDRQIRHAKIMAYFYFHMIHSEDFYFCPRFENDQILEWKPELSDTLWGKGAENFRNEELCEKMKKQIEYLSEFICDDTKDQNIDIRHLVEETIDSYKHQQETQVKS